MAISEEMKEEKKSEEEVNVNKEAKKAKVEFLYYELLKLVDKESQNQLNELKQNINILADEYKEDWNKLIVWDIPDQYTTVRQDMVPNGIVSQYTYTQLSESSGSAFNSPKFYG